MLDIKIRACARQAHERIGILNTGERFSDRIRILNMGERFSDRIIILNTGERFPDRMGPPPAAQAGDLAASPPCRPHRVTLREMAVFTGRGVKIKVKTKIETKRKEKSRPEDELKQDPKAGDEIKPGNPQRKQGQTTRRSLGVDGLGPQGEPQLGRPLRDAAHRNSRGVGQWKTWPLQGPVEAGTPIHQGDGSSPRSCSGHQRDARESAGQGPRGMSGRPH